MRIIETYKDWASFVSAYPSFGTLRKNPARVFADGPLNHLFPSLKVSEWQAVVRSFGSTPESAAAMRHDLGTLMGVGKGRNDMLEVMEGNFTAKFDKDRIDLMANPLFRVKMRMCVAHARKLGRQTVDALVALRHGGSNPVLEDALAFHFSLARGAEWDRSLGTIEQVMVSTRNGLSGSFRLAATPVDDESTGFVRTQEVSKMNRIPSPNKSRSVDEYGRELAHGSVHIDFGLFKTPPDLTARGKGYRLTPLAIASAILHEATHRWAQTDDDGGYIWEPAYARTMPEVRLNNADCYAWLAASLELGRVVKKLDADLAM